MFSMKKKPDSGSGTPNPPSAILRDKDSEIEMAVWTSNGFPGRTYRFGLSRRSKTKRFRTFNAEQLLQFPSALKHLCTAFAESDLPKETRAQLADLGRLLGTVIELLEEPESQFIAVNGAAEDCGRKHA